MSSDAIGRLLLQIEVQGLAQLDSTIAEFRAVDAAAAELEVQTRAMSASMLSTQAGIRSEVAGLGTLEATSAGLLVPIRALPTELAATGTAAEVLGAKTAVAGAETAVAGDRAALSTIKWNDLKLAYLGAGAASERNVAGLLALGGGAVSAEVAVAALGVGMSVFAIDTATKMNLAFQQIQANTLVTNNELDYMRETTLRLANDSFKSWSDIALAYEHAANEGFHFADATALVTVGLKAAEATGGTVADAVNTLATVMRDFHEPASRASQDMVILLEAAAQGNIRLPDLVSHFALVAATASAMHQPLSEAAALFSVLTKMTDSATKAGTQEQMMLLKILNPTQQAKQLLAQLSQTTGIDLVKASHDAADGQLRLSQYMALVREATAGNQAALLQLFGGAKSGAGAIETLRVGWDSYQQALGRSNVQSAEAQKILDDLARKAGGEDANQMAHLGNQVTVLAGQFGQILIPAVSGTVQAISSLIATDEQLFGLIGSARDHVTSLGDSVANLGDKYLGLHGGLLSAVTGINLTSDASSHLAAATHLTTEAEIESEIEHGRTGDALSQLTLRYATQKDAMALLTSGYRSLIEASKEYTAATAKEGTPGGSAATSGLSSAIGALPADLRSAMAPVLDEFVAKLRSGQEDYLSKVRTEDQHYQQTLSGLHEKLLASSKGQDVEHVAKLTLAYDQSVQKLKQEHDRHLADLQRAFLAHGDLITKAMMSLSSPGALFGKLKTEVDALAQTDLQALGYALLTGKSGVEQFTAAAVHAAHDKQAVGDAETEASRKVALGLGDFSTVIQIETQRFQKAYDEAVAKLEYDRIHGADAGQLSIDKQRVNEANVALGQYTTGQKQATLATEDFATALSQQSSKTFEALVEAEFKGKKGLDGLFESAVHAAEGSDRWAHTSEETRLRIDEASKNWAAALSDMRTILNDRLNSAEGKLQVDRRRGAPSSVLTADQGHVKSAQTALNDFEAQTKKSTKSLDDFSVHQQQADNRTKEALDRYAEGLLTNAKDLPQLRAEYIAAGTESKKFADALILAEKALKAHESASQKLDQERQSLQTKLNNAIAVGVEDIQQHGRVTAAHALQIEQDRKALALLEGQVNTATRTGQQLKQTFADLQSAAQKLVADDLDALAKAILRHASNVASLADKEDVAALASRQYADAMATATRMVALAMGDFTSYLTSLSDDVKKAEDKLATDTYTGAANNPLPLTPEQNKANQILGGQGEPIPFPNGSNGTVGDQDLQGIITAERNYQKALAADTTALLKAALVTGEWSKALQLVKQKTTDDLNNGSAEFVSVMLGLAGSVTDATARITTGATEQERQKKAEAAAARVVADATLKAALAAGDFSTAFNLLKTGDTQAYQQALDAIAGKIRAHVVVTQDDIESAISHRQSVEADTQAGWDAAFATSDLATQSKMLSERFSHLVSESNGIQSSQDKVNQAELTIIADQSSIAVGLLQDIQKGIEDETAVISAMSALATAYGDGQVTAVKDQTGIIQAQTDVLKATTVQERQLALDRLEMARDQYSVDQQAARWNQVIATQQVRIAIEKMNADRAEEAARAVVDQAKLKVDEDALKLAEDEQKLSSDMLVILNDIDSNLGSVNDYGQLIRDDLAMIGADNQQASTDQRALALDTARQQQLAAENAARLASDEQQLAIDQASAAASSVQGQMKIALDGQKIAADTLAQQQQIASILRANNAQTIAMLQQQLDAYKKFFNMFTGGSRAGRQRGLAGGGLLNQFTVDSHGGQAQ